MWPVNSYWSLQPVLCQCRVQVVALPLYIVSVSGVLAATTSTRLTACVRQPSPAPPSSHYIKQVQIDYQAMTPPVSLCDNIQETFIDHEGQNSKSNAGARTHPSTGARQWDPVHRRCQQVWGEQSCFPEMQAAGMDWQVSAGAPGQSHGCVR